MYYKDRLTPPPNWPPLVRYPSYYSDRRLSILWFLGLAVVALTLSVIALIIVFAVPYSWFHDNFEQSLTRYGLWRLCFTANITCESWFTGGGTYSAAVERRLNQSKVGINAWQALEIVFLFLTTATLIIAIASIVCYRIRHSLHYYLAILAVFCVWPAASVGVSALFVFGFAVYNVSTPSRELDWCFYVNLAAVILTVIAAILLSIYDTLLKKPIRRADDDTVIETFADLNGYPAALSPSTFVVVRRNKRQRNRPYEYSQTLHPSYYYPAAATANNQIITTDRTHTDFTSNPTHQVLTPYTSVVTTHEKTSNVQQTPYRTIDYTRPNLMTSPSTTTIAQPPSIPISTQSYRRPLPTYQYQTHSSPSPFHRARTDTFNQTVGYTTETNSDPLRHGFYNPIRSQVIERTVERQPEPRVLHYYTGYDYFATVDPSNTTLTRNHPSTTGPGSAVRYTANPPYQQGDYIKSVI